MVVINKLSFCIEMIYGISLVRWCRRAPGASGLGGVPFSLCFAGVLRDPPNPPYQPLGWSYRYRSLEGFAFGLQPNG